VDPTTHLTLSGTVRGGRWRHVARLRRLAFFERRHSGIRHRWRAGGALSRCDWREPPWSPLRVDPSSARRLGPHRLDAAPRRRACRRGSPRDRKWRTSPADHPDTASHCSDPGL